MCDSSHAPDGEYLLLLTAVCPLYCYNSASLHDDTLDYAIRDSRPYSVLNRPEGTVIFTRGLEKVSILFSKMPRSFLVKKHINSAKKPNYSELESPAGKETQSFKSCTFILAKLYNCITKLTNAKYQCLFQVRIL